MKKILFFIESLAGGGAEKVLTDLVCNLNTEKYDITVCTVSDNGVYQEIISKHCKYRTFLRRKDYEAGGIKKVLYWLKTKLIYSTNPRLIHKYMIGLNYDVEVAFVEGFATKLIGASVNKRSKKIAWVHTDMNSNPYADYSYLNIEEHIKTYKKFKTVVCVSETVKESYENKFGLDNALVVYNPVDLKSIKQKSIEEIDIAPHPSLQLVTVGRLSEQKGYSRLLNCINKLKMNNNFSLWIIGEGPQKIQLEEYIRNNQLEKCVKLIGFVDNPYKYVAKADAFVCSSYAEGYSTAATEALILGKPVFTVECSGMKELFGEYRCGEIVPNTDESLERMLDNLIQRKYLLASYSCDIKRRSTEFDLEKQLNNVERILDE